jgi:hypothetical protein
MDGDEYREGTRKLVEKMHHSLGLNPHSVRLEGDDIVVNWHRLRATGVSDRFDGLAFPNGLRVVTSYLEERDGEVLKVQRG